MASRTLDVGTLYADGTTLNAYVFGPYVDNPDGTAPPTATATAVSSGGTVTFTGLADGTLYYAGTGTGGYTYFGFSTPAASVGGGSGVIDGVVRADSPALERNVVRVLQRFTHLAAATWYNFPARLRPYEPGRRQMVVQNLHATSACRVGYGNRVNSNYAKPSDAEFTNNGLINPGQQIVLGADDRMLFCRPAVSGDPLDVQVYSEIGVMS